MPAPIDPAKKSAIKQAYLESPQSAQELSRRFNVSDRTIQHWIKSEKWDTQKTANVLINQYQAKSQRMLPVQTEPINIAEKMVNDLQVEFETSKEGGKYSAAISREIREWLRFQIELMQPRSVDDFANDLVSAGIPVRDFVAKLKENQAA